MKRLAMFCLGLGLATAAQAWLRPEYEDATIVERSELIVVGHLDPKSVEYVPQEAKPNEGRSWEHHAKLVIREVLKGKCETNEIPIIIHYGLTPIVGGFVLRLRDSPLMDARGGRKDYPTNRVEIMDTGNSAVSTEPLVEDAADDNLWFLRRRGGTYGWEPATGNLGIVDPEDLQPLKSKEYFLCYLSSHPDEAIVKYAASHPDVAGRVQRLQRYTDHLAIQGVLKMADPATRFGALLPYYLKGQMWDNKAEARAGIVGCGKVAGEKLVPVFRNPGHINRRQDIILLWRDTKYVEAAPILISLLEEHDRFWAGQKLDKGWWNADAASELTQKRQDIYGEVYYSVAALRSFQDPRAREAIELTQKRWATIPFDNSQILEECAAALKTLSKN